MNEQWPIVFRNHAEIYDSFSRAEDKGNKLLERLSSLATCRGRRILEIGCGTGKYIELIAPESQSYIAVDSSRRMIEFARKRCERIGGTRFIHCEAGTLPIKSSSIDVVFASWVISGIVPWQARERVVNESLRVLKPDGHIWLFENDSGGEFMDMRDPAGANWDKENVEWLMKRCGFSIVDRIQTEFRFPSVEKAKEILGFIMGQSALDYLKRNPRHNVIHHVLILHKAKNRIK